MELNEIKQRLELALRPVEPPTIEEVLELVSRHGVLRGPVDWAFLAWATYIEYATQRIIETFQLTEEEKSQLLDFRDAVRQLLLEAQRQAKAKLISIYRAVMEDAYRLEGMRLYASDGTWIRMTRVAAPKFIIHGVTAKAHFPDVLKLPRERLEQFQLGWRASDEGEMDGRPAMGTTQPWQAFAWAAARYGELYIRVESVNLTREGVSVLIRGIARSWRQRWSKNEAISLVADYLKHGEWGHLLTTWLGDGNARKEILRGKYVLSIAAKEPWRLGLVANTYEALVATGREAFVKLREAAGAYGELLDLLKAHKWIYIKLATDDGFRAAAKQNKNSITVEGIVMYLELVSGRGGSLVAKYFTRDIEKALAVADKLKAAELRPNIVKSGPNYVVYITTADLLKLAERDDEIRRAIALYLAEKVKNGTPRQREIAEKILKRIPFFNQYLSASLRPASL
ncbi:MAG: hypothetical protein GU356_02830 [Pyrobaculum sp.]|jgi:hypothetical protein|nr:hypothetical protein [Pyrobaculum sp.]